MDGRLRKGVPDDGSGPGRGLALVTATTRDSREGDIISSRVFVGNLTFDTTSDEIEALFVGAGEIAAVSVPTDRVSGRSRGFAFVEFVRSEDAARAIAQFDGHDLSGRRLRVNEATERPETGGGRGQPSSGREFRPAPRRPRPKGSRRNVRARKRGF
jgi:RNA recognition motif-containing protein